MSPSSQRVWIEIKSGFLKIGDRQSRPLHRGCGLKFFEEPVLEKWDKKSPSSQRVWIEISVMPFFRASWASPSSQRVWIEIFLKSFVLLIVYVALFTEGVDWNFLVITCQIISKRRPLHRGCGLKSHQSYDYLIVLAVALFTEGVDWNKSSYPNHGDKSCRPLHRGCGLKSRCQVIILQTTVALFTEGVDWNIHRGRPLHRGCGLKYLAVFV